MVGLGKPMVLLIVGALMDKVETETLKGQIKLNYETPSRGKNSKTCFKPPLSLSIHQPTCSNHFWTSAISYKSRQNPPRISHVMSAVRFRRNTEFNHTYRKKQGFADC